MSFLYLMVLNIVCVATHHDNSQVTRSMIDDGDDDEPTERYNSKDDPSKISVFDIGQIKHYFDVFSDYYSISNDDNKRDHHFRAFENNIKRLIMLNKFSTRTKYRINQYTHLSFEEFTNLYTGYNEFGMDNSKLFDLNYVDNATAANLDWRTTLGLKNTVKNQGQCKMSYVSSAIANVEAQYAKAFGEVPTLSQRQGFGCEPIGNCHDGGLPHLVLESLMKVGGAVKKFKYPTKARYEKLCKVDPSLIKVKISDIIRLRLPSEHNMLGILVTHGPVITAMYVSESVKNYHSGVLVPIDCNRAPNHAVLVVGYGISAQKIKYWIIQNSWGKKWGENGYMRLVRGENACNIGSYVVTANVQKYQAPPTVKTTTTQFTLPPHLSLEPETSSVQFKRAMGITSLDTSSYSPVAKDISKQIRDIFDKSVDPKSSEAKNAPKKSYTVSDKDRAITSDSNEEKKTSKNAETQNSKKESHESRSDGPHDKKNDTVTEGIVDIMTN